MPWVVWGFFKLITPFIDPLTREKLKFNEDMNQYVPTEQLWTEFNGQQEFEYDHSVYWPALLKLCNERREARKARWVAGGKLIGELEDYLSGHLGKGTGAVGSGEASVAIVPPAAGETRSTPPPEEAEIEEVEEVTEALKDES